MVGAPFVRVTDKYYPLKNFSTPVVFLVDANHYNVNMLVDMNVQQYGTMLLLVQAKCILVARTQQGHTYLVLFQSHHNN